MSNQSDNNTNHRLVKKGVKHVLNISYDFVYRGLCRNCADSVPQKGSTEMIHVVKDWLKVKGLDEFSKLGSKDNMEALNKILNKNFQIDHYIEFKNFEDFKKSVENQDGF